MFMNKEIVDFKDADYFSYETHCNLWEHEKISLIIDFGEEAEKSQMLSKHINKINNILSWVNTNKDKICNFLVSKDIIKVAEEWVKTEEQMDDNTYKNSMMQEIKLPITEKEFCNAIFIDTILIDFDEDETRPDTTLHILFNPDYFKQHSLILYIDGDNNLEYGDITA